MLYHEALGGKYVPRTVLFDLELGVIGAVALSRRSASSSARTTSLTIQGRIKFDDGRNRKSLESNLILALAWARFMRWLGAF